MYPAGIYFTWHAFSQLQWRALPPYARALTALAATGILSSFINHETIDNPIKAAFKVKYFILGALAIAPANHLVHKFFNITKYLVLLYIILACLFLSTFYGLIVMVFKIDFLGLHKTIADGRILGFTDYMRHAHSALYCTVILTWARIHLKQETKSFKLLLTIGIIIGITAVILTGTRGAMGALLLGMILIWGHKRWVIKALLAGFIVLIILFTLNSRHTIDSGFIRPVDPDRANIWRLAIKAFAEKPLLGHGMRQFENQAPRLEHTHGHWLHQPSGQIRGMAHAHNNILQILADLGLVGLISYLMWLVMLIRGAWGNIASRIGMNALIFSFCAAGTLQYGFDTQGSLVFMLVPAMILAGNSQSH